MITKDIHSNKETVNDALYLLDLALKEAKRDKDKILCLITGYGSRGGTHKIRTAILDKLSEYKENNRIKAFILGGDIDYGEKYIEFLKSAPRFYNVQKERNNGVIYIAL
ncbi:MAG: hypothetical protein IKR19_07295 [Acholeplasmatales bacterium]|nr:hypothetical protein [Acholeplasmatales bacterium]